MNFDVTVNGRSWQISLEPAEPAGRFVVGVNGRRQLIDAAWIDANTLSLIERDSGHLREAGVHRNAAGAGMLDVAVSGRIFSAVASIEGRSSLRQRDRITPLVEGRQAVVSSMPGRVARVLVQVGDRVTARQGVVIVEAMKMENELRAPKDGIVREVAVREGAAIERGALLMVIE